jgi:hypothetical protein
VGRNSGNQHCCQKRCSEVMHSFLLLGVGLDIIFHR